MFGCSCARFHSDWAQGGGAAFGEDYAVDPGSVGDSEKRAKILRVFYAIEREQEALLRRIGRGEKVLDGQGLLLANKGDDALMRGGAGEMRELFARFLATANTRLFAICNEAREAFVVAFGGDNHVIEAA